MEPISGPTVTLRAVQPADVPVLRDLHAAPAVARWWGAPGEDWPLGEQEPGLVLLTMWRSDTIVGFIQFWEETDPRYRHAAIDLFVAPDHHRQGIGREALTILIDHLVAERGHHRITIDPALDNAAAITCYTGVGFTPAGVLRAYELDPVTGDPHDALFMELIVLPRSRRAGRPPADVTLRPATTADIDAIVAAERSEPARHLVGQDPPERHAAAIDDPQQELLVITRPDGRFAGYVHLAGLDDVHAGIELRRLVVTSPGEGIGRAAVGRCLDRAFATYATHRVWLDVVPTNHRARRLYDALGFRTDGIVRDGISVDGRRQALLLLSLLRREWMGQAQDVFSNTSR